MSRTVELILVAGGITTALLAIGGVLWWLIWPRIEDKLQELVRGVSRVETKLGDDPDTPGRHARVAAEAAAYLPAMREQLEKLTEQAAGVDEWRGVIERRMGSVEGALLALLGPELRRRLFTDLTGQEHTEHPTHREEPPL